MNRPPSHSVMETHDVRGGLGSVRSIAIGRRGTRRMQASDIQQRSIAGECRSRGHGNLLLWQLLRVQAMVDAHLIDYISNRQLADCVRMSQYHFARAFRRSTGMSPQGYVARRRIERAQCLMLRTDTTLSRIAFECGFSDQSHFSRTFVKATGETPRTWRRTRLANTRDGSEMSLSSPKSSRKLSSTALICSRCAKPNPCGAPS
jgi:AraC-like DNA-binding protein